MWLFCFATLKSLKGKNQSSKWAKANTSLPKRPFTRADHWHQVRPGFLSIDGTFSLTLPSKKMVWTPRSFNEPASRPLAIKSTPPIWELASPECLTMYHTIFSRPLQSYLDNGDFPKGRRSSSGFECNYQPNSSNSGSCPMLLETWWLWLVQVQHSHHMRFVIGLANNSAGSNHLGYFIVEEEGEDKQSKQSEEDERKNLAWSRYLEVLSRMIEYDAGVQKQDQEFQLGSYWARFLKEPEVRVCIKLLLYWTWWLEPDGW